MKHGAGILLCALAAACGHAAATGPGGGGTSGDGGSAPIVDGGAVDLTRGPDTCAPTSPRATAPEVGVLPDDGEGPQVAVLMNAQKSIRVFIYEMGYGGILDALEAKAKAGVDVRVILDTSETSVNQKYADALTAAGAKTEWSDAQFTYMHAKTFIVDEREAVISTGNYSLTYSIQRERNFTAHLTDRDDVADLVALFDADWDRKSPSLACTRLVVSPINSRQRILDLINSATKTLTIESMQFADNDVRLAVANRQQAGVEVRALLAAPSWITANTDAATYLAGLGIPARYLSTPGVHVKALVIDGATAYIGSENFSYTSLSKNREIGVFLIDASSVKPVADTFEKDWAVATSF